MITYTDSLEGIIAAKLQDFFVGWPKPPSPETHLRILSGSDEIVLAIDDETGRVVGFITAITDGVLTAFIPLLEVLPDYQHKGIASELVRHMLAKLSGYYAVDLTCEEDMQPFYEKFGMRRATGMVLRRY